MVKIDKMRTLSHREQAREKLPVFYGSRDNYLHGFREILNNGIDEVLNNFDSGIVDVILNDDLKTITIKDSGRGIPIQIIDDNGIPYHEIIFTTLFSGGKMDDSDLTTSGTNGLGSCVLNYTSEVFKVEVCSQGYIYYIEYENGGIVKTPLTKGEKKDDHYTSITFKLDKEMYTNTEYTYEEIRDIILKTSKVSPKITLTLTYGENKEIFNYNSLQDYFEKNTINNIVFTCVGGNKMYEENNGEKTQVELVFSCSGEDYLMQECMLNGNNLIEKSSIHEGIINGFKNFTHKYLKDNGLYEKKEKPLSSTDIENCLIFCCKVLSNRVEFKGQTKFSTEKKLYKEVSQNYMQELLEIYAIENQEDFKKIANHILVCKRANEKADKARQEIKKKLQGKSKNVFGKIEGLTDCDSDTPFDDKEIWLCEGLSACSTLTDSRNDKTMATYPLKGRFINALKSKVKDVLNNDPAYGLIQALGCGIEAPSSERKNFKDVQLFNIDNLRYSKIIIATDADSFGHGITLSLLAFFYKFMPTLLRQGRIYIAVSPRYQLDYKNKLYFAYTENEKNDLVKKYNIDPKSSQISVIKGLGQLNQSVFWNNVMNPDNRTLKRVVYQEDFDEKEIDYYFNMLIGEDINSRKQYVKSNITNTNIDEID